MDLLPIGSIFNIKGAPNLDFMIAGYFPESDKGEKKTYIAVKYPAGIVDKEEFFFVNNEDIENVSFEGYKGKSFDALKLLIETSDLKDFK